MRVTVRGHVLAATAAAGLAGLLLTPAGSAIAQSDVPFTGTASALGVRMTVSAPGLPGTNTPVDSGGPTAQARLDSLGSASGYAAFPDPGEFLRTVPSLGAGVLGGGAAGLPPIELPEIPDYPLAVATDADLEPEASVGEGPYRLTSSSSKERTVAAAVLGGEVDALGNVARTRSDASVTRDDDGVVATATVDVQGLTLGPLTIGQLTSTATMSVDRSGRIRRDTDLEIAGARLAGLPVSLTGDGLVIAGVLVEIPINLALETLLSSTGSTIEILEAETFDTRVIAPAIEIRTPVELDGIATATGEMTMVLGSATASLEVAEPFTGLPPSDVGPGAVGGEIGIDGVPPSSGSFPSGSTGTIPSPESDTPSDEVAGPADAALTSASNELIGLFDVRLIYLCLVLGSTGALLMGQAIRLLGVRNPWTSSAG